MQTPKPVTYDTMVRDLVRRVAELERFTGRPGIDPAARDGASAALDGAALASTLATNAADQAALAQTLATNVQAQAANAEALAVNAEAQALNAVEQAENAVEQATLVETVAVNAEALAANAAAQAANAEAVAANAEAVAVTAQTSADGKNQTFAQSTEPTAAAVNDTWINTSASNRITIWNGSAWVVNQLGAAAISDVDASVIAGTLGAAQIGGVNAGVIGGQLVAGQIGGVNAGVIGGQLVAGQIGGVNATVIAGQIIAGQIATGAVTTAKLAAGAVTATEIGAGAITTGKLAAGAVTATEIGAGAIIAGKIGAGAIVANDIAATAISSGKIAAGAITTGKIAAGAVTATEIGAGAIIAGKIAAGAVTATEISAGAITTAKLFAGAVTATEIGAGAITTAKLAAGAVTATEIAAGAITAVKLDVDAMTAKNFYSAVSGNRIIIGPAAFFTEPRITFDYDGTGASANDPSIKGKSTGLQICGGTIGVTTTILDMGSPTQPDRITMTAVGGTGTMTATLDASIGTFALSKGFGVNGNASFGGNIASSGTFVTATGLPPNVTIRDSGSPGPYRFEKSNYAVAPSSRRYKEQIVDLRDEELDPAKLLELPVRQFRYTEEQKPEDRRTFPGFIAEEVAECYPIAAFEHEGVIENYYDRYLLPAMLALIQSQHTRINALEAGR